MKRLFLLSIFFIAGIFLFTAFQPGKLPEEVELMVQERIEQKVNDFRKKIMTDCRKKAIEKASDIVDSLLILKIKAIQMDSVVRPDKPLRPDKPEIKIMEDTSPIIPILSKDSLDIAPVDSVKIN